jgi:hypothetical protein
MIDVSDLDSFVNHALVHYFIKSESFLCRKASYKPNGFRKETKRQIYAKEQSNYSRLNCHLEVPYDGAKIWQNENGTAKQHWV